MRSFIRLVSSRANLKIAYFDDAKTFKEEAK